MLSGIVGIMHDPNSRAVSNKQQHNEDQGLYEISRAASHTEKDLDALSVVSDSVKLSTCVHYIMQEWDSAAVGNKL